MDSYKVPLSLVGLAFFAAALSKASSLVFDGIFVVLAMLSFATLCGSICVEEPLEVPNFPDWVSVTTLLRLMLAVSGSGLVLSHDYLAQPAGPSSLVSLFGGFFLTAWWVLGLVSLGLFIGIQLMVVTNGAERIAQVAARFTLDAMPGKQMAIDADLHAGNIDADVARERRTKVLREADFYGSMDATGKIVKAESIAAVALLLLIVLAGTVIGLGKGMDLSQAFQVFLTQALGLGFLLTSSGFFMSTSIGMIVSRAASDSNLS